MSIVEYRTRGEGDGQWTGFMAGRQAWHRPLWLSGFQRLEDIEAIKQLKARCSLLVDRGDRAGFAELFTEDGEFIGAVQRLSGRDAIGAAMFWPFMVHYVANPIIDVSGDTAVGTWYFLRPYTAPDGRAHWASGIYEDEYRRIGRNWKFKQIRITNFFACPHEQGWTKGDPHDPPIGSAAGLARR